MSRTSLKSQRWLVTECWKAVPSTWGRGGNWRKRHVSIASRLGVHSKSPSELKHWAPTWCVPIGTVRGRQLAFDGGLHLALCSLIFFLCCRLASSELNIKKILQGETTSPADCFLPKWKQWWANAFIYINNQLKGLHRMWAFIFDDILIVAINNNIFTVGW